LIDTSILVYKYYRIFIFENASAFFIEWQEGVFIIVNEFNKNDVKRSIKYRFIKDEVCFIDENIGSFF